MCFNHLVSSRVNLANKLCLSFNFQPAFAATFASDSLNELKHLFMTHILSTPLQIGHKVLQKVKGMEITIQDRVNSLQEPGQSEV